MARKKTPKAQADVVLTRADGSIPCNQDVTEDDRFHQIGHPSRTIGTRKICGNAAAVVGGEEARCAYHHNAWAGQGGGRPTLGDVRRLGAVRYLPATGQWEEIHQQEGKADGTDPNRKA